MAVDVGSAVGYLDLDISGFLSNLQSAQSEASKKSKSISSSISSGLQTAGSAMTSAGTAMSTKVTAPLVAAGTAAFTFSTKFESAMAKVGTIADTTKKPVGDIKKEIVDLSNKTGAAAEDVAEATYQAISAGVDTADSVKFVAQSSKLATAGFTDTTTAVDALTTVLNAYGLEASDAEHVSDVLISTQNKGKTTVNELAASMGKIIPTANAMGVSLEDLGTGYSYLTASGIATAEATTYMNGMFNELGKSGTKVSDILKQKTGKSFQELMKSGYSVRDVLDILQQSADETGVGFNDLWSSQEAGKAALALLNTETEDYNATLKDFQTTEGDTEEAFNKMANTTEFKLKVALQNGKNALIQLGDSLKTMLLPFIEKGVEWLKKLNTWLSSLDESEKEQIVKIAAIVAAIGPVLLILGKVTTTIRTVIGSFGKMKTAISTVSGIIGKFNMTNIVGAFGKLKGAGTAVKGALVAVKGAIMGISAPVAIVVAVIATLVAAFATLWKTNEKFRNKITSIWNGIVSKFKEAGQKITEAINSLGFNFTGITEVLKSAWEGLCNFIAPIFEATFGTIGNIIGGVVNVVTGVIQTICGIIKGFKDGDWTLFLEGIKTLFTGAINLLIAPYKAVFETFKEPLSTFSTWWSGVWSGIKEFFSGVWLGISSFFSTAINGIKNVATAVFGAIASFFKSVWNGIKNTITSIVNGIKTFLSGAWNAIKTIVTTVVGGIKTTIVTVFNTIKSNVTTIVNGIETVISTVWNGIKSIIGSILSGIKSLIVGDFNGVKNSITSIMNAIKSTVSGVWNAIKTTISTVVGNIKTAISTGLNAAKGSVTTILGAIKGAFTSTFNGVKSFVGGIVNWLKGIFKFEWSLPKIKLPHFTISGSFSLNPPKVPSFNVSWYRKAMSNGMILNSPTIFGYDASTGKFLGGGEAGSETVVGTQNLMGMIASTVSTTVSRVLATMATSFKNNEGDIIIPIYIGDEKLDTLVIKATERKNYRSGGR